jgi:hypothetical protein
MKRKILLTTIIFAFCGFGLLTLRSSAPQPNYTTARVYWFDNLTVDCNFTISGYVYGGGSATESFTATFEGAEGNLNPHKDYVLEHGFISGNISRDYTYYVVVNQQTIAIHVVDTWPFWKGPYELFDVIMDLGIAKVNSEVPIE